MLNFSCTLKRPFTLYETVVYFLMDCGRYGDCALCLTAFKYPTPIKKKGKKATWYHKTVC